MQTARWGGDRESQVQSVRESLHGEMLLLINLKKQADMKVHDYGIVSSRTEGGLSRKENPSRNNNTSSLFKVVSAEAALLGDAHQSDWPN